jgi:hypothetical protein
MEAPKAEVFSGRIFSRKRITEIIEIVDSCPGLSRTELANTICELYKWKRPSGRLKTVEGRQFLEYLESKECLNLPERKKGRPRGSATKIIRTDAGELKAVVLGKARYFFPLALKRVQTKLERQLWYEYVDRYHYLGYKSPFGAQIRYFIESAKGDILGCLQFSSPAWKMRDRDKWIGWSEEQRKKNLQKIVNNSRFLILPWIRAKNLASSVLAKAANILPDDWEGTYGYRPVLLETLVDRSRFQGTSYKAANWAHIGMTTGRGRMDRANILQGMAPKEIYAYPIENRFREALMKE